MRSFSRSTALRLEEIEQLLEMPSNAQVVLIRRSTIQGFCLVAMRRRIEIDRQLDLVAAIVATPEMTDFVFAHVRR